MTVSRRFILGSAGAGILFGTSVQASSAATFAAVTSTSDPRNIRAFKLLLNGLGWRTAVDTTYTRIFYDFVRSFQRRNGLPVTGLGDEATIRFLASRRTVAADTTSWHAGALKVLLHKHGYVFSTGADATPYLTGSSLAFAQTMLDLGNFRVSAGYGHTQSSPDVVIWTRLFGAPRIGGLYPVSQLSSSVKSTNCGPASAVAILASRGKLPRKWAYTTAGAGAAIDDFRRSCALDAVAGVTDRNKIGTEYWELLRGFATYGLTGRQGGIADTISLGRAGRATICGGNIRQLPWWRTTFSGDASHWIAVLGTASNGEFVVIDPYLSGTNAYARRITEAGLRLYASTNPGYRVGHPRLQPPNRNSVVIN